MSKHNLKSKHKTHPGSCHMGPPEWKTAILLVRRNDNDLQFGRTHSTSICEYIIGSQQTCSVRCAVQHPQNCALEMPPRAVPIVLVSTPVSWVGGPHVIYAIWSVWSPDRLLSMAQKAPILPNIYSKHTSTHLGPNHTYTMVTDGYRALERTPGHMPKTSMVEADARGLRLWLKRARLHSEGPQAALGPFRKLRNQWTSRCCRDAFRQPSRWAKPRLQMPIRGGFASSRRSCWT